MNRNRTIAFVTDEAVQQREQRPAIARRLTGEHRFGARTRRPIAVALVVAMIAAGGMLYWSAPHPKLAAVTAASADRCLRSRGSTISEITGPFTASVLISSSAPGICVVGRGLHSSGAIPGLGALRLKDAKIQPYVLQIKNTRGPGLVALYGRAGAGVTAILFRRKAGPPIRAVTHNGWFLASWLNGTKVTGIEVVTKSAVKSITLPAAARPQALCSQCVLSGPA